MIKSMSHGVYKPLGGKTRAACRRKPWQYNIPPLPPGVNITDFYRAYYSPHPPGYVREIRALPINPGKPRDGAPDKRLHTRLLNPTIIESHIRRLHYHWIRNQSYYASISLKERHGDHRFISRITFDFDETLPGPLKDLKARILEIHNDRNCRYGEEIQRLREEARDTVIDENIGATSYYEALSFSDHIGDTYNADVFLYFSGMKGVHATIDIDPAGTGEAVDRAIRTITNEYLDEYSTLDPAVAERQTRRVDRIPYTCHLNTGLYAVPILPGDSYEAVLTEALNPTRGGDEVGYRRMVSPEFMEMFRALLLFEEEATMRRSAVKSRRRLMMRSKPPAGGDVQAAFMDLKGEPERRGKDYLVYYCDIHDDQGTPNLYVYKDHWHCYACNSHGYTAEDYLKKANGGGD